jgi:hypothetical protein
LGFGVWGLGVGDNPPIPNPQSPIPNPQSPINKKNLLDKKKIIIQLNNINLI